MNINQISYQKTFNLGNYSSERIGVEIVLNEGEDAKEALNTAKALVEEYHQQSNNLVVASLDAYVGLDVAAKRHDFYSADELPVIQVDKRPSLEQQIRSCTELKVLKVYESMIKKDPILQEAYNQTMRTLQLNKSHEYIRRKDT